MIKKIITSIIVLPLLIVPLFCCCIKQASAATIGEEHCHDTQDSHSAKHDQSESKQSHSCDCSQLLSAAGENSIALHSDNSSQQQIPFQAAFVELFSVVPLKGALYLAYLGPPGGSSAVPFYTLYHSLRI